MRAPAASRMTFTFRMALSACAAGSPSPMNALVVHCQAGLPFDEDHIARANGFAGAIIDIGEDIAAFAGLGENPLMRHDLLLFFY